MSRSTKLPNEFFKMNIFRMHLFRHWRQSSLYILIRPQKLFVTKRLSLRIDSAASSWEQRKLQFPVASAWGSIVDFNVMFLIHLCKKAFVFYLHVAHYPLISRRNYSASSAIVYIFKYLLRLRCHNFCLLYILLFIGAPYSHGQNSQF